MNTTAAQVPFRFKQQAERAFINTATCHAVEVGAFEVMEPWQTADFARQVKALPKRFLDFSQVEPTQYNSPDAAVAFGLFAGFEPEVEAAVDQIIGKLFPVPSKAERELQLAELGFPQERLLELAANHKPGEPDGFGTPPNGRAPYPAPQHNQFFNQPGQRRGIDLN